MPVNVYKGVEIPSPVSLKDRVKKLEEMVQDLAEQVENLVSSKVEPVEESQS